MPLVASCTCSTRTCSVYGESFRGTSALPRIYLQPSPAVQVLPLAVDVCNLVMENCPGGERPASGRQQWLEVFRMLRRHLYGRFVTIGPPLQGPLDPASVFASLGSERVTACLKRPSPVDEWFASGQKGWTGVDIYGFGTKYSRGPQGVR
jgi:hypothetical protein